MNGGQGRPILPNLKVTEATIASGSQSQLTTFFRPVIKDAAVREACLSMEIFFQGRQQFAHLLKTVKSAIPQKGKYCLFILQEQYIYICHTEP